MIFTRLCKIFVKHLNICVDSPSSFTESSSIARPSPGGLLAQASVPFAEDDLPTVIVEAAVEGRTGKNVYVVGVAL